MPIIGDKLDALKADIAVARKRPLAFGLCLGKSPETTVLINHKTKDPEALGRQAKKEGETSKFTFGMMTIEGKNLNLSCHDDPPTGLARKTKDMLKAAGLKLKVRILDAEGNVFEEDGDDEEEGEGGAGAEEGAEDNPEKTAWEEAAAKLGPRIEAMGDSRTPEVKKLLAVWSFAKGKVEGPEPDYAAALKSATMLTKLLDAAAPQAPAAQEEAPDAEALERARRRRGMDLDDLETELRLLNRSFA